jgi:hypothetical protein
MALNLIPPPLTQLHCTWALAHVREYVYVMHASAFNILMASSVETITTLCHFHPKTNLVLDREANIYVLMCSPCLSSISLWVWCMRFCGIFLSLMILLMALIFEICRHIACDHLPPLVSCLFVASQLLALEKQAESIQPITIRKVIY